MPKTNKNITRHLFSALYTMYFFGLDHLETLTSHAIFGFPMSFAVAQFSCTFCNQVDLIITQVYILLPSLGVSWGTPSKNGSCMTLTLLVRNFAVDVHTANLEVVGSNPTEVKFSLTHGDSHISFTKVIYPGYLVYCQYCLLPATKLY